MPTERDFAAAICGAMGWEPTPWRLGVLLFWGGNEYPDKDGNGNSELYDLAFNPLATTRVDPLLRYNLAYDRGYGPGNWNWVPVKVYDDFESGVIATVQTLSLSYYVNIRRCFADQRGYQEAVGPQDFTSWVGSAAYGQRVVDFMNFYDGAKALSTEPQDPSAALDQRIGELFLPLLKQALGVDPSTFSDVASVEQVRDYLKSLTVVDATVALRALRDHLIMTLPPS